MIRIHISWFVLGLQTWRDPLPGGSSSGLTSAISQVVVSGRRFAHQCLEVRIILRREDLHLLYSKPAGRAVDRVQVGSIIQTNPVDVALSRLLFAL